MEKYMVLDHLFLAQQHGILYGKLDRNLPNVHLYVYHFHLFLLNTMFLKLMNQIFSAASL